MSDTTPLEVQPEIARFVAKVRAHLADLTEEEREELVGGLEADLAERVSEVGEQGLGDPAAYAAELRAAAGLEVRRRRIGRLSGQRLLVRPGTPREQAQQLLDGSRTRWERLVSGHRQLAAVWAVVATLQPAWWVLRAWVAVQFLDQLAGPPEYLTLLPTLGVDGLGPVVLLAAVVVSVQLGRAAWWPSSHAARSVWARLTLAVLNVVAAILLLILPGQSVGAYEAHALVNGQLYNAYDTRPDRPGPGLMSDGHYIRNVFPFDSAGRPLTGVQLYDQRGRPVAVSSDPVFGSYRVDGGRVRTYPWANGSQSLYNVFPLPVRQQAGGPRVGDPWTSKRVPTIPPAPLAVVPPASLPTQQASGSPSPAPTSPAASPSPSGRASAKQSPTPSRGPSRAASPDSEKPRGR